MTHKIRGALLLLALVVAILPAVQGCLAPERNRTPIVVGVGDSVEQQVLGELAIDLLESAGYRVEARRELGAPWMVRKAIEAGSVDLIWDYTGRVWSEELGHDQALTDPAELYRRVRDEDTLHGLTWITYTGVEDRLVLIVPEDWADDAGVRSITDLAYHVQNTNPDLVLCTSDEIASSSFGPTALKRVYGLSLKAANWRRMPESEAIVSLNDGSCQGALVSAARIPANTVSLRWLWDDRSLLPASNLAPVARSTLIHNYPELAAYLRRLSQSLDNAALATLLQQVADGKSPSRVARQFLRVHDVLSTPTFSPSMTPSPSSTAPTSAPTPLADTPAPNAD
ncbi:MAG: glycine betaine ABC transporter substrate-binding protein [Anaerolineales bacterium]